MYKQIRVPEEYVDDVKSFIDKKKRTETIKKIRDLTHECFMYAYSKTLADPAYQEAVKELQKPYLEHYTQEFRTLLKEKGDFI